MSISISDRWVLVDAFIKDKGLVRQHLDSYNDFIEKRLQEIIDEQSIIETKIHGLYVKFGKIEVGKPIVREADGSISEILPMEARIRNLSYSAPIYLYMTLIVDGEARDTVKAYIGDMPIMVKSKKCYLHSMNREQLIEVGEDPDDPGGYFIINGSERVLVIQEDLAVNRVLVDIGGTTASVTHTAKVFSATTAYRTPVIIERHKDGELYVSFPAVAGKIPLIILMKALGLTTDKEIVEAISSDPAIQNELIPSLLKASSVSTIEDALDYIGNRVAMGQVRSVRLERAQLVIDNYLLPHLGNSPERRLLKAYFLGQMVEKLLEVVLERRPPDDKDHYANKRLKLAGDLLAMLFRSALKQFIRDMKYQLERMKSRNRLIDLITLVRADIITDRLQHAMATGNWIGGRTGVSQLLDRTNYLSTISHLRRVVSPLSRSQPHFEARELHATQWGRLCPAESPEGQNCGLVKNLALLATLSIGIDEQEIEDLLYKLDVVPIEIARSNNLSGAKVFLNGRLIGIHATPDQLVKIIRKMRRKAKIPDEVNIAWYKDQYINEIYVNCDSGRIRRPLLVVENGKLVLNKEHIEKLKNGEWQWSRLIKEGIVEYLDVEEEENARIAINPEDITPEHTHMEIIPSSILGIIASTIPYAEHNQSPRNTYEAAMAKQALGLPMLNFKYTLPSRMHLLHYPQKPLVRTKVMDLIGIDKRPYGQNFVVAVMGWGGYNIEDAIILNKSSIERGLARSTFYRVYETEKRRYPGGQEDNIEIPDPSVTGYRSSEAYRHLDSRDGIVRPEAEIMGGEALVGKTSPPRFFETFFEVRSSTGRRDTSLTLRHGEKGIVDKVIITHTSEDNELIKVRVRDQRIPELGDKFASRHGQKGVIGMIVPQEDMPFTEDGIVPDLIINPHAIPSRMTVGQLLESLAGKVAALDGRYIDATPFEGEPEEVLRKLLLKLGFREDGKEVMYDGRTGKKLKAKIFIGIVYYQKLHHMVSDKMHARARGPVQILTRQPTEGRAREGGLRFGEMEKDCLVGHGAAMLLKERLFEESDKTYVYICNKCGFLGYYDARKGKPVCRICGDKGDLSLIEISYAFKLLLQELMSLGIAPRLILGDVIE